ncbi:stage 0 sporulation family protein [Clostridium botulinum]|uniref:Stage 0 sporulation protein n=1 Tax=Clostridium botulinum C/D str. DC5 TaxID=1443128 RepID=A0A0A0IBH4_CLOBO|nr:stage 0 sporulation family protein [Clostridium botulinum]KEI06747.1 stage 0 sporulation protein [Clostridium botulinum C/D str. BKT75002]KEI10857.1 stage 0 sporulation protein [Clostridium botulinum C/D str. BKT2873]KGM93512.1 stage 0 sporulation protein [Clostridium botulinum D str. CCUG 7971]KGM97878.1 stage 0 sporulation protein [Clostridium botulinum C/D str. DC5]KOC49223.1 stage 0 sporulation protein [Clostridium botulinum]
MITVVGIRFKKSGKIYYFSPNELDIKDGKSVIVETVRGIEFGHCVIGPKEIPEEAVVTPLKNVIRKATEEDIQKDRENKEKQKEALDICLKKIEKHNLPMKLIDVEYTFDNNKIIFYFTAEGRVDFRELVKDLASVFRTRIELRQIGVRDEAKMIGGLGPCGRALCCSSFLGDFVPVSIKMAKEQNLSLNPTKISGICGRLMCCLNYEQDTYEDIKKQLPKIDSVVDTPYGKGTVISNSVVNESVKIKIKDEDGEDTVREIKIKDLTLVSGEYEYNNNISEEDIKLEVDDIDDKTILKELLKED